MFTTLKNQLNQMPVFNKESLVSIMQGNVEMCNEILNLFLIEYPKLSVKLSDAIKVADSKGIVYAAHSIKGMCSGIYELKMSFVAEKIEKFSANNIEFAQLPELHQILDELFEKLKSIINQR